MEDAKELGLVIWNWCTSDGLIASQHVSFFSEDQKLLIELAFQLFVPGGILVAGSKDAVIAFSDLIKTFFWALCHKFIELLEFLLGLF